MPTIVNIHEAKTHLSRLLAEVAGGEEVIIAKHGHPLARLVPVNPRKLRTPGRFLGKIHGVDSLLESAAESAEWLEGHPDDPLKSTAKR